MARIGCAAWAGRPAGRTGRTQTPGLRVSLASLLIAGRGGVWGCDKTRDGSGAATLSSRCATKRGTPACRRCVCLTRVAGRRAGAGRAHVPPSARLPVCHRPQRRSGQYGNMVMAPATTPRRRPPFRDDDASPCRRRATPNRQIQQRASRLFVFPGAAADSGRRSQQRAALA